MKNLINKIVFSFCFVLAITFANAQVGLEGIIVEKYYIADAADNAAIPTLPIGAVTYRVYADLAAGWEFQALYGEPAPSHFLKINSTQPFLNFGTRFRAGLVDNTALGAGGLALDSWFTVGAANDLQEGVLKAEDNGLDNLLSTHPQLNNAAPAMGIGLKVQDGMHLTPSWQDANIINLTVPQQNASICGTSNLVSSFSNDNCAIAASAGGAVGPTASNKVLIGQFTTTGSFGYELNVQIRNTTTFVVEKWVANSPAPGEFTMASLTLAPNVPPTVTSFTATPPGPSVIVGTLIDLAATATDVLPGTVSSVKFYHNGVLVSNDNTSPYGVTGIAAVSGANTFLARAFDNSGDSSVASTILITGGANTPPTVTISGVPASACQPDVITVVATPIDIDGTVASVKFYLDNVLVFTDNASPWEYAWPSVSGSHNFKAEATDNLGATGAFSPVSNVNVVLNNPPTVALTSPLITGAYTAPAIVPMEATATDPANAACGSGIALVKFFVNGILVGQDATSPYQFNWTSVIGTAVFTARAYDNRNDSTTSAPITLEIADPNALPYKITNLTQTCESPTFCLTVAAVDAVSDVIGYDFVLNFDNTKVTPTGVVIVNSDLTDSTDVDVANSIDELNGKMNISLYFNGGAPTGATWNGIGDIMCVQFAKKPYPIFEYVDSASFTITVQESYVNGPQYPQASAGKFKTYKDSLVISPLKFWADNSPIVYTNAAAHLITNIYGTGNSVNNLQGTCLNRSLVPVQPDASGFFTHSIWNGTYVDIERDIAGTTSVQPAVNGYDVYLVRRLLILDASFTPNIYQMIAMDVNRDGVISAGDASQISQRAVLQYPEFRQAWNYSINGTPIIGAGSSKDWTFMLGSAITTTPAYGISTTFPADNGVGYSKYRVPVIPFCLQAPVVNAIDCPIIGEETYIGVMLGDVNGNYSTLPSSPTLRSNERVVFDLTKAVTTNTYIDIPVSIVSGNEIHAMDFSMQLNSNALSYNTILSHASNTQMFDHFNANDNTLRFTSNSLDNYNLSQAILSVRLELKNGKVDANDLLSAQSYLNGNLVPTEIRGRNGVISNNNVIANVYPNPTSGKIYVSVEEDATVQLFDISGKELILQEKVIANTEKEINASQLANGIYLMKISNNNFVSTKKVVINK